MAVNGGILINDDGSIQTTSGTITSDAFTVNGWLVTGAGHLWVTTAAPAAGDPRRMGFAFTHAGALYLTKSAVGADSSVQRGVAISAGGAIHVSTTTPSPAFVQGGWTTSGAGVLFIAE